MGQKLKFLFLMITICGLCLFTEGCRKKKNSDTDSDSDDPTTSSTKKSSSSDDDDDDDDDDDSNDSDDEDDGNDDDDDDNVGGFGSDPGVFYFSAETGTVTDGDVIVTLDFPNDVTSYDTVEIRWVEEGTAPVAACNGGSDGTHSVTAPYSGQVSITLDNATDSLDAGTVYSFRACVFDSGSGVVENPTEVNIPSKGTVHRIFISSGTYDGNLAAYGATGTLGADNRCQTLATAEGLTGTWKAIISGDGDNAVDRVDITTNKLYNMLGDKIADDQADLFDASVDHAITYDETGTTAATTAVWTGSDPFGVLSSTPCVGSGAEWTNGAADTGYSGSGTVTGMQWLRNGAEASCATLKALYCINQ